MTEQSRRLALLQWSHELVCGNCEHFEPADEKMPVPGCAIRKGYFAQAGRAGCEKHKRIKP